MMYGLWFCFGRKLHLLQFWRFERKYGSCVCSFIKTYVCHMYIIIILIIIKNKIPIVLHCRWTLAKHPHLILDFFLLTISPTLSSKCTLHKHFWKKPTLSARHAKTFRSYCTIFCFVGFFQQVKTYFPSLIDEENTIVELK